MVKVTKKLPLNTYPHINYSKGMRCNFCRGSSYSTVFKVRDQKTGKMFSVLECNKCHLCRTSPLPKKQDLKKYYEGYRDQTAKRFAMPVENFIHFWHKGRVKHIAKLKRYGKILDVGCGRALELVMLKKLGWQVYATELSRDIEQNLKEKGVKPFFGEIWQLKNKNIFFDVVCMWHSLEHLYNPQKVITTARKLLKKNGYLIIEVPNFSSTERKIFQKFWFHLDVPRHIHHFPKETLIRNLKDNNFSIIAEKHVAPEYDFFSFWQGSVNKLYPNYPNIIYKYLARGSRFGFFEKAIILSQLPILALIIAASFIVVPVLWFTKQSGTIEITAKK